MTIFEMARDVHTNAVQHGWWDGERDVYQIVALIHSEWSEALEEARAGRGMVWYNCNEISTDLNPCNPRDEFDCLNYTCQETCEHRSKKPEGIAVELIDGVIRILDLFGAEGLDFHDAESGAPATVESLWENARVLESTPEDIATLVAFLHRFTADAVPDDGDGFISANLLAACSLALSWVHERGCDPMALLMEKHEYNRTRSYRHGKKF